MSLAKPILLEPVYDVAITVPDEFTGDVMGDLNTRRARVQGMNPDSGMTTVEAQVPYSELLKYATDLRTQLVQCAELLDPADTAREVHADAPAVQVDAHVNQVRLEQPRLFAERRSAPEVDYRLRLAAVPARDRGVDTIGRDGPLGVR